MPVTPLYLTDAAPGHAGLGGVAQVPRSQLGPCVGPAAVLPEFMEGKMQTGDVYDPVESAQRKRGRGREGERDQPFNTQSYHGRKHARVTPPPPSPQPTHIYGCTVASRNPRSHRASACT